MVRAIPRRCATSVVLASRSTMAAIAMRSAAFVILRGRPPRRPRARAAASPARVRSRISSASNSANAAKIPKTRRPFAVVVSNLGPLASHDLQSHLPLVQGLDQCYQVPEIPPEPIELPHHQRILWAQGL